MDLSKSFGGMGFVPQPNLPLLSEVRVSIDSFKTQKIVNLTELGMEKLDLKPLT
jgi:hypothetical protein